jgi:hypothetical protein
MVHQNLCLGGEWQTVVAQVLVVVMTLTLTLEKKTTTNNKKCSDTF